MNRLMVVTDNDSPRVSAGEQQIPLMALQRLS
jgi:hypothetical protein